ncbi:MAG: SPOR domain-containing protein [Candidatus Margulisbacteria bacterium]|nr:SPOR domain-containing protein [Candidatus Margulisiibacteriota bacterium]
MAKSQVEKNDPEDKNEKEEKAEEYSFDDLDKEVGLGDILKEKDNIFFAFFKKISFGFIVIIISIIVFFASFTIGKMLFLSENAPANRINLKSLESQNTEINETAIPTQNIIQVKAEEPKIEDKKAEPKEEKAETAVKPEPVKEVPKKEAKKAILKKVEIKEPAVNSVSETPKEEPKTEVKKQEVAKTEPIKEAPKKETVATEKYMVIAGTFINQKNADILIEALKKLNYSPEVMTITKNNMNYIRVIAGVYNNLSDVKKHIALLKSKGFESFSLPYTK